MKKTMVLLVVSVLLFTVACQCITPEYLQHLLTSESTSTVAPVVLTVTGTRSASSFPSTAAEIEKTRILQKTEYSTPFPTSTNTVVPLVISSPTVQNNLISKTYDVKETIELTNDGPGIITSLVIWVALIQTIPPYQVVESSSIIGGDYEIITDEYGNQFAEIQIGEMQIGDSDRLTFEYRVTVNSIDYALYSCTGIPLDTFLNEEEYIESNAADIVSLAETLQQGKANDCETARSIYDYIGDNFIYSKYTREDVGALQALEDGSGDCTEFSDLYIALNRAAGIPANFVEGVTCCTTDGYTSGSVQHDWVEVYLPANGWVPVDSTWGRFPNKREIYFAGMTPDHIIITRGRNLDTLGGFHYYYYQYRWQGPETEVKSTENWSILETEG